MKVFVFISFALLAVAYGNPAPGDGKIHIPDKCEDVLAVKVCTKLTDIAAKLKLKSEEVKNAVIDAYKQGKTKSEEIYSTAKDFLVQKVLSKRCEDLTSQANCDKLRKHAADMKIKAEKVKEFIVKQIAELKTKTCEDFLTQSQCTMLTSVANKLKIKMDKLQDALLDAYLEAKTKGTQMIEEAYNKIKQIAVTTKCEDMFNANLCAAFRKYAEKTKVAIPRIMETAADLVIKGVAIGKSLVNKVFDVVDYFYDCTDVFDQSSCDRIKKVMTTLKVSAEKFEIAFRKYMRIAIEKGTSIYNTLKDFIVDKIWCRFSSSCVNDEDMEDELEINKRGLFGDWKNRVKAAINARFPNLETKLRSRIDAIIAKSKTYFSFMRNLALEILKNASAKWQELLKHIMSTMVL